MNQCQLCLSYIKEIKQMSEQIKVKGILLNEQEKNHKDQIEGLQRHIDALKGFLASKGILLNEGEEKELIELNTFVYHKLEEAFPTNTDIPVKWDEESKSFQEVKDDYDYTADDMNFDAARERKEKS